MLKLYGLADELAAAVFGSVAETIAREQVPARHQAIVWQALAREAMLRSQAARHAEREATRKGSDA
jgi:hypothetical protein